MRFEYCIDNLGNPQYRRAIEAHSVGAKIDAQLQRNITIPYGWTKSLCHIGSSYDYRSIVEGGLFVGGISSQTERQACFFAAVDPMNVPMLTPRFEENEP